MQSAELEYAREAGRFEKNLFINIINIYFFIRRRILLVFVL